MCSEKDHLEGVFIKINPDLILFNEECSTKVEIEKSRGKEELAKKEPPDSPGANKIKELRPRQGENVLRKSTNLKHNRKHQIQKTKKYTCIKCGKSYNEKLKLNRHIRLHKRSTDTKNQELEKKDSNVPSATVANPELDEKIIYDCIYCFKAFMSRKELDVHTLDVHNVSRGVVVGDLEQEYAKKEKTLKCTMCQMSFSKNYSLARHLNVHQVEKEFPCNLCGRSFDDAQRLEYHQKIHTDNRDITCNVCNKNYQSMRNLRRHQMSVHEAEKSYKCQEDGCPHSFSRKDKYMAHLQKRHKSSESFSFEKISKS